MMCPEWAAAGTVRTSPTFAWRSFECGDERVTRAFAFAGKATIIPLFNPVPPSRSVPCVETWWGLPLQKAVGIQLTLLIRTVVTCALGEPAFFVVAGALFAGAPAAPGAVPPEPAPAAAAAPASRQRSAAAIAAKRNRLCL
jgi:hypothetical protein